MIVPRICPLTHLPYEGRNGVYDVNIQPGREGIIVYRFPPIGVAYVTHPAWLNLTNGIATSLDKPHYALAGLCCEAFERGQTPPELTTELLRQPPVDLPYTFDERAARLLQVLYDVGGRQHKPCDLEISRDFPLAYAEGRLEFSRLLEYLISENLLMFDKPDDKPNDWVDGIRTIYYGVLLKPLGRRQVHQSDWMNATPGIRSIDEAERSPQVQQNFHFAHGSTTSIATGSNSVQVTNTGDNAHLNVAGGTKVNQTIGSLPTTSLLELVGQLKQALIAEPKLETQQEDIANELQRIDVQLKRAEPKRSILARSFETLHDLAKDGLGSVAGHVVFELLKQVPPLLG